MFGKVFRSATGIAKSITGTTKNFRGVLGSNPGLLSLALPPQVSMGIRVANQLGFKIPSEDVLIGKARTELDKALSGLYRSGVAKLEPIVQKVEDLEATLNSIEWLL